MRIRLFKPLFDLMSFVFNRQVTGGKWLDNDRFVVTFANDDDVIDGDWQQVDETPPPIVNERMRR